MKFIIDGLTVEIKVTKNGKKADKYDTHIVENDIELAFINAANFCTGQGWTAPANRNLEIARAIGQAILNSNS